MTGFLLVVCLLGTLTWQLIGTDQNGRTIGFEYQPIQGRVLSSIIEENSNSSSLNKNGLILYKKTDKVDHELAMPVNGTVSKQKPKPFEIVKDFKKLEGRVKINSEEVKETKFLNRKRFDFVMKMERKEKLVSPVNGFLQKPVMSKQCVKTDNLDLQILNEELDLHDDNDNNDYEVSILNNETHTGIVPKTSSDKMMNQVVPLKDMRYSYENLLLRQNVKSLYCRDFITTAGTNAEMFKNLFSKLNNSDVEMNNTETKMKYTNDAKENTKKENEDDCLYLHMIVPSTANNNIVKNSEDYNNNNTSSSSASSESSDKKVYYEVGCKIFEINKIYK